jgi:lipopolysaccharide transport protein LptA
MKRYGLCCWLLILFSPLSWGHLERNAPVEINSDYAQYHHPTGVATHRGQVKMVYSTTTLLADQLDIYRDPAGEIQKFLATGQPATLESTMASLAAALTGQAQSIYYLPQEGLFVLEGQAQIQQGADTLNAPKITLDIEQQAIYSERDSTSRPSMIMQSH